MDAQTFWNVIGIYNQQTVAVQIVLFLFAVIAAVLSYSHKVKWAAKFALGIIHLFIGIAFFAWHGIFCVAWSGTYSKILCAPIVPALWLSVSV